MKNFFRLLTSWCSRVQVTQGGETRSALAFVQPVSVSQPEYTGRPTPAGTADDRRYLLIAEPGALTGDRGPVSIELDGRTYELLRWELMGGGSHWEGIMKRKAGGGNA